MAPNGTYITNPMSAINAPTAGESSKTHHKGLAKDTVGVGEYVVKSYVWTYVVLPTKLVKGTINAVF
jgi:hypothetical protein